MTGHTPKWGLPYPEPADYVSDSQAVMRELAEKIDALVGIFTVPGQEQSPATVYPVAPYLVDHVKTSGPWTPPAGVTVVDLVIVTGGQNGSAGTAPGGGTGGHGGVVRVLRNVKLGGEPINITVGGAETSTTVAGHKVVYFDADPWEPGTYGDGGPSDTAGYDGIELTGPEPSLWVAAGGGGGGSSNGFAVGKPGQPGGRTGGAPGGRGGYGTAAGNLDYRPTGGGTGAPGFGGGGGGGGGGNPGAGGGGGGSGAVLIFTQTPYPAPRARRAPVTPTPVAAIDEHDLMVGVYAVDADNPQTPGIPYTRLVPFPLEPVDTGRTYTAPADPDDPDGPTVEAPVLAWPEAGWTYTESDGWKDPA